MHITDWIRSKFKKSLADTSQKWDALWAHIQEHEAARAAAGVHPEPIDDAMSQAIRMLEVSDQAAKDRN